MDLFKKNYINLQSPAQAYVEHVAPLEAGEFSSDEEAVEGSPSKRASNVSRSAILWS